MKTHKSCGTINSDDAIFCIGCGARLEDEALDFGYTPNISEMPSGDTWNAPAAQPYDPTWNDPGAAQVPDPTWNQGLEGYSVTNQWEQQVLPDQGHVSAQTWDAPASAQPAVDPQVVERLDSFDALLAGFADTQRDVSAAMLAVTDRLSTVEQRIGDLASHFEDKITRNEHEVATMKRMSDEVQEYRNGLYEKLTLPLIRDIIETRDALGGICQRYAQDPNMADIVAEINVCRSVLADKLARQSVEVVTSGEGDEFLSFKHKIVGKVHTNDPSLQGRIAEVSGDSYRLGDQYLSPAMVKVYALD